MAKTSEAYEHSSTIIEVSSSLNQSLSAAEAIAKNSNIVRFIGKASGITTVVNNGLKAKEAWDRGDKWTAVWHGSEAIAGSVFLIVGGEGLELGWNLGSWAVDTALDYFNGEEE